MIFKKRCGEERKKEDENCFKSRLKYDKRLRRLKKGGHVSVLPDIRNPCKS